jgi:hypothetical protein
MPRRLVVVLAVLTFVAGACSGGGDKKLDATSKRTTTTESVDRDPELTLDGTTTSVAGSSATTTKGATATTTKGKGSGGGSGTTAPGAGPAPTADPNAVPGPAATGTYNYAQSGQVGGESVPPNGTLNVSGGQSQVFSRRFDPNDAPSDIYFNFTPSGPFITRVVVRQGAFVISCTFGSPVPAPPWPPTSGRSFSGHSTCDNGFAADFSGIVGGHDPDTVGGKSVDTIVINSTLHITGNLFGAQIDITVKDTQHWAPSLRVPTYSHETISGTVSGDVTSTLTSTP